MKTQCLRANKTQHYCGNENAWGAGWVREEVALIKSLIYTWWKRCAWGTFVLSLTQVGRNHQLTKLPNYCNEITFFAMCSKGLKLEQSISLIFASKISWWWFSFRLVPIFNTAPVASKNTARLKRGQNQPKNNHLC